MYPNYRTIEQMLIIIACSLLALTLLAIIYIVLLFSSGYLKLPA